MQELRESAGAALRAGTLVEARRARWQVRAVRPADQVTLVHLTATERREPGARALLSPFDPITPAPARPAALVSRRRWVRALGALAADTCPYDTPASTADTDIVLIPFQLEPLLAMRTGVAARLLVADAVGLGKTIQAALIARDLVDQSSLASILIVTPAGLRDQWQRELRDRVGLDATIADAAWLHRQQAALPPAVNPWRLARIVIVSIDFVKQPEIARGLRDVLWSLLVIDEAHVVSPGTDRFDAASCLAEHSERVVLLTATPHDGDDRHFAALCGLGRIGDADTLAVFRRTRDALPPGLEPSTPLRRVVRRLRVRTSAAEARLHALLGRYVRTVWRGAPEATAVAGRLAMSVLVKRAASSPWSLEQSLRRRRDLLTGELDDPQQAGLNFGTRRDLADEAEDDADAVPYAVLGAAALPSGRERIWLNLLIQAASAATAGERKLAALTRLLRRTREPALVFTEYRDTLQRIAAALAPRHAVACLHGGLTADQRRRALDAFTSGAVRVLLATDAGSQGLNLQHRCRLVVHVELPWSPLRIDQRNGRVDRIGQTRAVHAIHLIGRATTEALIEARLDERRRRIDIAMARTGIGTPAIDEAALLGDVLVNAAPDTPGVTSPPAPGRADDETSDPPTDRGLTWPSLRVEAGRAAALLGWLRMVRRRRGGREASTARTRFLTHLHPRARRRLGLGPGLLSAHRTRLRDAAGAIRETSVTVRHLLRPPSAPSTRLRPEHIEVVLDAVGRQLEADAHARLDDIGRAADRADAAVRRRREAIARRLATMREADQLDLFDDFAPPHASARLPPTAGFDSATLSSGRWSADVETVLVAVLD